MAFETDIWVHGIGFEARFPADFVESPSQAALHFVERDESGAVFRSPPFQTHFFQLSIPTPAILNDFKMRLRRVTLLYDTNAATIRSVRVFDGTRLVRDFSNLGWSGSHSNGPDGSNDLVINPSDNILNGLAIFVEVDFAAPPLGQPFASVHFSGARIQLLTGERLVSIVQWVSSLLFDTRAQKRV